VLPNNIPIGSARPQTQDGVTNRRRKTNSKDYRISTR